MIRIKSKEEIETMREGGKIVAGVIKEILSAVKPGIITQSLNDLAHKLILSYGGQPSFLGYDNFPASICTSINEEIVHGLPSDRILKEGDLLKIDIGVFYKGFHTDSAATILVSSHHEKEKIFPKQNTLIRVTREALDLGISKCFIGNTLGDVGHAIQKFVESNGYNVIRDLIGHGIGRSLHEEPEVPNYGKSGIGPKLVEGMVIAIEPMVVEGKWDIKEGHDGFAFSSKYGGFSAHFEHTVAITKSGPKILTEE